MRLFIGLLLTLVCESAWALPVSTKAEIKGTMQVFYKEMSALLPLSLKDETFLGAKNAKGIQRSLDQLEVTSRKLKAMTKPFKDEALHLLGQDFHYFSKEASIAFRSGNKHKAQALIQFQSETCMSCHTMRQSAQEPKLKLDFISQVDYSELGTWEKARFLTLARQFSASMSEYERLLGSDSLANEEKLLSNAFNEYMVLGLRVTDSLNRVVTFFKKIIKKDQPLVLQKSLESWVSSMEKVSSIPKPWTVDTAKKMLKMGANLDEYPADQKGIVFSILASKIIRDLSESQPTAPKSSLAEYQYLLGKSELAMDPFGFKSMSYFARAIRLDPNTKTAQKAFKMYKQHLYLNFSGSSGTNIPEEQMAQLRELSKLATF